MVRQVLSFGAHRSRFSARLEWTNISALVSTIHGPKAFRGATAFFACIAMISFRYEYVSMFAFDLLGLRQCYLI